jgi:hypothetical protein
LFFERKLIVKKYFIVSITAILFGCGLNPTKEVSQETEQTHMGHAHNMHSIDTGHERHDGEHETHVTHNDPFGGISHSMGADCGGSVLCPESSTTKMYTGMLGDWHVMAHGKANLVYTASTSPRGKNDFSGPNHFMVMMDHSLFSGTFRFTLGTSLDVFTEAAWGKPQLLQTGELYQGRENIDVQHRHKLITNLSTTYVHPISPDADWFCSAGLVGDASGVPMEFHRASASQFADVSLFHHGTTDKHITSSVFSCGVDYKKIRMTAFAFHGQEPTSDPYVINIGTPDSFALSLQYLPTSNWALSLYYAYIRKAERSEPGDVKRFTASAMYVLPLERDSWWASTAIFTHDEKLQGNTNIFVLESTLKREKNYFYGRLDAGQKHMSLLETNTFGRSGLELSSSQHEKNLLIGAVTAGYARVLWEHKNTEVGIGADVTGYALPKEAQKVYGSFPWSTNLYLFFNF